MSLEGKTITVIDGGGKGQTRDDHHYDPETHEYTIEQRHAVDEHLRVDRLHELHAEQVRDLAVDGRLRRPTAYDPTDGDDSYDVVLTGRPTCPVGVTPCEVVVDVTPLATRTYDSRQAFNPAANFGQANQVQVRVATTRAHFTLTGTPANGQHWIAVLDGTPFAVPSRPRREPRDDRAGPRRRRSTPSSTRFSARLDPATRLHRRGDRLPSTPTSGITPATDGTATVTVDGGTATVSLGGTPTQGEVWTLTLDAQRRSPTRSSSATTSRRSRASSATC